MQSNGHKTLWGHRYHQIPGPTILYSLEYFQSSGEDSYLPRRRCTVSVSFRRSQTLGWISSFPRSSARFDPGHRKKGKSAEKPERKSLGFSFSLLKIKWAQDLFLEPIRITIF